MEWTRGSSCFRWIVLAPEKGLQPLFEVVAWSGVEKPSVVEPCCLVRL